MRGVGARGVTGGGSASGSGRSADACVTAGSTGRSARPGGGLAEPAAEARDQVLRPARRGRDCRGRLDGGRGFEGGRRRFGNRLRRGRRRGRESAVDDLQIDLDQRRQLGCAASSATMSSSAGPGTGFGHYLRLGEAVKFRLRRGDRRFAGGLGDRRAGSAGASLAIRRNTEDKAVDWVADTGSRARFLWGAAPHRGSRRLGSDAGGFIIAEPRTLSPAGAFCGNKDARRATGAKR